MSTINAIKTHYAIQALTRPKKPVFHIQKPRLRATIESGPAIHIQGRGKIVNIKA